MKYKLIGKNDIKNPIETIFSNRQITNINDIINVSKEDEEHYSLYDNMDLGVELLLKHINNNSKIDLVVDSDCDGITSASILYMYIKEQYPNTNISYVVHKGKKHGLSNDIVIGNDVRLVILPDASSNEYEQHKKLFEKGIDVLVIDHHLAEKYSEHAVTINNQLSPKVKNKNLSGVGVVYKFLQALDDKLNINEADNYLDLVALGNVADSMDLREKETRYYVKEGLNKITNEFLKALIKKNEYSLEGKFNITSLGWVIAPKLNAVVRNGTVEDNLLIFEAMIGMDKYLDFKPRGKDKVSIHLTEYMANKCASIKTSQDNAVKEGLKKIEPFIEDSKKDKILVIDVTKTLKPTYTGLVANKLASKYKRPTLLLREKDNDLMGGSARGNENVLTNLRELLIESNLFEFCEGHENSFGLEIKKDNVKLLKNYLNNKLKDVNIVLENTYEVDLILNNKNINKDIVKQISDLEDEWGNKGFNQPLIAFEDIEINSKDISLLGERMKVIKFTYKDITFIKKFATEDAYNNLILKTKKGIYKAKDLKIKIIGKCVNNIYNNNKYPQVEIVDMESEENEDKFIW